MAESHVAYGGNLTLDCPFCGTVMWPVKGDMIGLGCPNCLTLIGGGGGTPREEKTA